MTWAWVLDHLPACPSYLCVEFRLGNKLFHSFCTGLLSKAYSLPDITTLVSNWIILPGPHCLQSIDSDPSPSWQLHCMHTWREGQQQKQHMVTSIKMHTSVKKCKKIYIYMCVCVYMFLIFLITSLYVSFPENTTLGALIPLRFRQNKK